MSKLTERARTYRLPNPTTPEDLECRWSKTLRYGNLKSKFESHHFDIQKLWAMNPATPFDKITNHSKKIKI